MHRNGVAEANRIQAALDPQVELPSELEHAVAHATQQLQDLRQWEPPRRVSCLLPHLLPQHAEAVCSGRLNTHGCSQTRPQPFRPRYGLQRAHRDCCGPGAPRASTLSP